eukprot:SAG11_NODE_774_length_7236_cov_2.593807_8_plen_144_part_00
MEESFSGSLSDATEARSEEGGSGRATLSGKSAGSKSSDGANGSSAGGSGTGSGKTGSGSSKKYEPFTRPHSGSKPKSMASPRRNKTAAAPTTPREKREKRLSFSKRGGGGGGTSSDTRRMFKDEDLPDLVFGKRLVRGRGRGG